MTCMCNPHRICRACQQRISRENCHLNALLAEQGAGCPKVFHVEHPVGRIYLDPMRSIGTPCVPSKENTS